MTNGQKESSIGFWKILLTAIITSIATIGSQYFIMGSKHERDKEFWKEQYNISAVDKMNDKRFKLLEEFNEGVLQLEIQSKEIKIESAAFDLNPDLESAEHIIDLMVKYQKDLHLYASKTQMITLFYDGKVDSLIPEFGEALQDNFSHNLLPYNEPQLIPSLNIDFETTDELTDARLSIIKAMFKEIQDDYALRNED